MTPDFDVFNPLTKPPCFTQEQLQDIRDWFDENAKPLLTINDGSPINVITIKDMQDFLDLKKFHRRSFKYPTYGEIMKYVELLNASVLRVLTFEQFIYILNQFVLEPHIKHELILAFKVFDTEQRDFLELETLKDIVTKYGDTYSESETIELLRDANVNGDGNIFYNDFIQSMFDMAPELYELKTDFLYENPDEDPSVEPEVVPVEEPPPPPPPPPKQPKGNPPKGNQPKGNQPKGKKK